MAKKNKAQPQPERTFVKELWVCAGQRLGSNDQLIQQWHELTPKGLLGTVNYYKPFPHTGVGGVYEISVARDSESMYVRTTGADAPAFQRRWEQDDAIAQWTAQEEGALARKRRKNQAAKALDKRNAYKVLEPFAEALALAETRTARAAVLANFIVYMENRAAEIRADSYLLRQARRAMGGE